MIRIKIRKNKSPLYPSAKYIMEYTCSVCHATYDCYFSSGPVCRICSAVIVDRPEDLLKFFSARENWHNFKPPAPF